MARQRCWRHDWVLDLDIQAFFDTIPHDLLLRAVRKHTDCKWVLLYSTSAFDEKGSLCVEILNRFYTVPHFRDLRRQVTCGFGIQPITDAVRAPSFLSKGSHRRPARREWTRWDGRLARLASVMPIARSGAAI